MKMIHKREDVLEALESARQARTPLLCPNAETRDEMEAVLNAAEAERDRQGLDRIIVGMGITASYPDHPQLENLRPGHRTSLLQTFRIWHQTLSALAEIQGLWEGVAVIPFLDHGWVPHREDIDLMESPVFQEHVGIVMFDASALPWEENVARTADYVERHGSSVVVEACPDKIPGQAEIRAKGLRTSDLLSDPETVEAFVNRTGVDLIVPSLGTEHRGEPGADIRYRREVACEITRRVGPRLALHGTSSLGGSVGGIGKDGVCKVNFYTAMALAASAALKDTWGDGKDPGLDRACGSFVHRTRRAAAERTVARLLQAIH